MSNRRVGLIMMVLLVGLLAGGHAQARQVATGVTAPVDDLLLGLPVAGRIDTLLVREGDWVNAGDVILELDQTLEALELERRRLMLEDESRLQQARTREATLREQLAQAERLYATDTISRKQMEDERLAWQAAVADLAELEISKQQQAVDHALAVENLQRRSLRAPVSGVVARLNYQVGESVSAHEPVVRLVNTRRVQFTGNVAAHLGALLKPGQRIDIVTGIGSHQRVRSAEITFVSPVADPASGLLQVKAEFDNDSAELRPGLAGRFVLDDLLGVTPDLSLNPGMELGLDDFLFND